MSAALSAMSSVSEISNLADQDDVGILAQHAAQRLRRSSPVSVPTSRWLMLAVDVAMQELDRILDRDHVRVALLVDVLDHRRERRRLAGARHARDEHEAARPQRDVLDAPSAD